MCSKMNPKCFFWGLVGIALIMAILSVTLPLQWMGQLILVTRFFEVMIPVLAVGALLKYLSGCGSKCQCNCCHNGNKTCNGTNKS